MLDLEAIKEKWLKLCGACDVGIGECNHPAEDYRPVMLALVRELEKLPRSLTDDERRFLAATARNEANKQVDWRYQNADPDERKRLRLRWREIADALHPDPYNADVVFDQTS